MKIPHISLLRNIISQIIFLGFQRGQRKIYFPVREDLFIRFEKQSRMKKQTNTLLHPNNGNVQSQIDIINKSVNTSQCWLFTMRKTSWTANVVNRYRSIELIIFVRPKITRPEHTKPCLPPSTSPVVSCGRLNPGSMTYSSLMEGIWGGSRFLHMPDTPTTPASLTHRFKQ